MRYETLTPLSVFHKSIRNTTLQGYFIPAGTVMINNLAAMNHDPDLWGDPENFRPERFLTDDGRLNKDISFPFGIGKSNSSSVLINNNCICTNISV